MNHPPVRFAGMDLAPSQRKSIPILSLPVQQFFDMGPEQREDQPVSVSRAYKQVALVFSCMRYRVTKLIEAPLWIYKEGDDGEEVALKRLSSDLQHLRRLFEQPNPDQTMGELLEQLSLYEDTTGSALIVKNKNGRGVTGSMYAFSGDEFSVEPSDTRMYGKFTVNTLKGTKEYRPDEVIYFRLASSESPWYTVSPVDAALMQMNLGYGMFQALRSALRNAVRPGAVFEHEGNLDETEYERLKKNAETEYAGIWNMGKAMVLEGGITTKTLGNTLGDLELGPVNGDIEAGICSAFGVHPALVGARIGLENSGGFADLIKSATELFYDITQLPRWVRYEEKLTQGLLRPVSDDDTMYIRFIKDKVRALQINMTDRVNESKNSAGFWTIDEQRGHTGKPALPDGKGKELSKPAAPANKPGEEEDDPKKPKPAADPKKPLAIVKEQ